MARPLTKSPFVLLALGLWILACSASLAQELDPNTLNQQVNQLIEQGKYQEAMPIAERALEVAERTRGPEQPETADALSNLGVLFYVIGDYAKAEPLLQEALRIRQKVLGPEHSNTATSLNNLALLYQDMGQYAKAESLLQEGLRIDRKVLGPEHPDTANTLNSLALLYIHMGAYAKAEPLLQEVLRICRKVFGPEHPDTAQSLNNLGVLYRAMGAYAKAEPLYQAALQIYRKVRGPEHPDTAQGLNNLGVLYQAMGEYAKAEPFLKEAFLIWQKVLGQGHPLTATGLDNLALLDFDLDRIDKSTALARQASAAELTILSKIFSFASEEQRLAYLDIFHPYGLFPMLKGTEGDLAVAVLRYKGVVLDSIVEDRLLRASEDQKLVKQLNLDKQQVGQLLLQPAQKLSAETRLRIEALEGEVEKIEGQLAQHVAGLGQTRHALGVTLGQVQSAIPNDCALIEFLRYGHYLGKGKWEQRYGAIRSESAAAISLDNLAYFEFDLGRIDEARDLARQASAAQLTILSKISAGATLAAV